METTIFYNLIKKQHFLFASLLCFILFTEISQSQTTPEVLWAKQFGGVNMEGARDIDTDAFGNIYLTGLFWYETDFEDITLTTSGLGAPFVVKTDPLGNVIWAKQFGSSGLNLANGIAVDSSANVYTIGTFNGIANFDSFTLDAGNSSDIFVLKQNSSGNVLWVTPFTTPQNSIGLVSESIVLDTQGNIYTSGYFSSDSITLGDITLTRSVEETTNAFITKQDSSGNVLWAKKN